MAELGCKHAHQTKESSFRKIETCLHKVKQVVLLFLKVLIDRKVWLLRSKTTCFIVRDDYDIKIINIMALILYISAVYKDNDIKRKNDNEILM